MKHRINLVKFFLLFGLLASCNQKNNIEAYISGLENDTIYVEGISLSSYDADVSLYDTVYSVNGKFSYNLPLNEPMLIVMLPKEGEFTRLDKTPYRTLATAIFLIVEPGDRIRVNGKLEKFYLHYIAEGSPANKSHSKLRREYKNSLIEETKIELALDTLMYNRGDRNEIMDLFQKRGEQTKKAQKIKLDYVINNWNNDLSAFYLVRQHLDTLGKYYEFLGSTVREGIFKNMLDNQFIRFQKYTKVREAESRIQPGEEAPEFILSSIDNSEYSFTAVNDRYTVLYFWGSWCGPCISGLPKMRDYSAKYNNYFDIIAIACNDNEDNWRETVRKHELTSWTNLINEDDINKDVSVMYAVHSYPTKVIIRPDGLIDGVFRGEGEDFYNSLNELLKK